MEKRKGCFGDPAEAGREGGGKIFKGMIKNHTNGGIEKHMNKDAELFVRTQDRGGA